MNHTGSRINIYILGIILFTISALLIAASLFVGPSHLSFQQVMNALCGKETGMISAIVNDIRLPRILLAYSVGAALAVSGVVFQGLLGNPLAGPFTLGISSGAAFGATIAIFLGLAVGIIPIAAMIGALLTLLIVLILSMERRALEPRNLVLAGIIVSSFFSAGISFAKSLSGDSLQSIVFWIMGSLSGKMWIDLQIFIPYFMVTVICLLVYGRDLDILSLGDDHAHSLGVDVSRTRYILIITASMLAAAAVSVSGVIGFVGLVVPHLMRMICGPSHRKLLMTSFFGGGILLVCADSLARLLAGYAEIPVGVITSLIGGPFFCYLLLTRRFSISAKGGA
jgi:iron complex transport system permease protein